MKILEFVFFVSIVVPGTTVSVQVSPSAHLLRRVACPGRKRMVATVMDQVTLLFTELTSTTKVVVETLCVLSVILLLKANWN